MSMELDPTESQRCQYDLNGAQCTWVEGHQGPHILRATDEFLSNLFITVPIRDEGEDEATCG